MVKIAVLVSGGGTNLQALIDAEAAGKIKNGRIAAVISSNPGAFALKRAQAAGINAISLPRADYPDRDQFTAAVIDAVKGVGAGLIVLAGFMHILGPQVVAEYPNRIINVHPSLIPAFCGEGCFGLRVHRKAIEYGVKISGATVHFVSEEADAGPIILQKAVRLMDGDTPESLQKRIMEKAEWELLPRAVSLFCEGRLEVAGRNVKILRRARDEKASVTERI